jgi:eukaryotic-like serine/threonine-protein kinase
LETHRITQNLDPKPGSGSENQLQPGAILVDRYVIQGILGTGGMGAVYRARDMHFPNINKLVAVKEMINQAPDPLVRQVIVRNFEREANILATLEHRAIPHIFDYFSLNERSYLIIEYIKGKDLESIIQQTEGFLPEARLIGWAIELCDVLDYLHHHQPEPIIFRDMKPSNVMINNLGHVVLVDFGIAKHFESGQKGTMIGTEGYSPPEQYRGEATPKADIYSLGASLHHALTRKDPRLEAPFSFAERPIRQINRDVSSELELVINKSLNYEPEDRFASVVAMKEALIAAAQDSGLVPNIPKPEVRKPGSDSLQAIWSFACEDEVRGTPLFHDGYVYVGCYDNNLYAIKARNGEFMWKYPTDAGIVSRPICYENNLYIGSEDQRLHVIQAQNGRPSWTYATSGPVRSSPAIAAEHIFIGSDDGYLHAINTIARRRAWAFDAEAPVRSTPLIDHERVFFGNEAGDFFCLDFSGTIKWRFKAKRAITSSAVISQGVVYFTSLDSTLYALDAKSGWAIWRFRLGKPSISTPFIKDNLIFCGAIDGNIYCNETGSSKEVWRFTTAHQVTGSPLVYKDSLYCGSVDGFLYCLEYHSGRLRWKFKTQGPITGSPVASEDIIFIGSTDHSIYALTA